MLPVAEEEGDGGGRNPLQERRGGARGSLGLDLAGLSLEEVEKAEEGEVGELVTQNPAAGSGRGRRRAETAAPCQEMEALLRRFGKNLPFLGLNCENNLFGSLSEMCKRHWERSICFDSYCPTWSEMRSICADAWHKRNIFEGI